MDLTTLGYALLLGFSTLAADGAVHADSYDLRVEVHEEVRRSGYGRQYVESCLAFEMKRIFRHESAVKAASAGAAGEPSVTAALTDPLGADKLRFALRNLLQLDPLSLEIYIMPGRGEREDVRALGFASRASGAFFEFQTQAGRRTPPEFLAETAMQAALLIDEYHARLAQARAAASPDAVARIAAALARHEERPAGAKDRDRAELIHLAGMVAFRMDRLDHAEALFTRALSLEPGLVAARANLALVNLVRGRHLASLVLAREAETALAGATRMPAKARRVLRGAVDAVAASTAEAARQPELARTLWQRACAGLPQLGHLLSDQRSPWLPAPTVAACWTERERAVIEDYEAYGWELAILAPPPAELR